MPASTSQAVVFLLLSMRKHAFLSQNLQAFGLVLTEIKILRRLIRTNMRSSVSSGWRTEGYNSHVVTFFSSSFYINTIWLLSMTLPWVVHRSVSHLQFLLQYDMQPGVTATDLHLTYLDWSVVRSLNKSIEISNIFVCG